MLAVRVFAAWQQRPAYLVAEVLYKNSLIVFVCGSITPTRKSFTLANR